jgi:hypothetical protein
MIENGETTQKQLVAQWATTAHSHPEENQDVLLTLHPENEESKRRLRNRKRKNIYEKSRQKSKGEGYSLNHFFQGLGCSA